MIEHTPTTGHTPAPAVPDSFDAAMDHPDQVLAAEHAAAPKHRLGPGETDARPPPVVGQ
ncbi:hypothetical protein [Streptomyces ardesiacus]|uniref:hypothetical protein n=1 Tax=Streptomyces ardesiacus TaxID=285564 RepID=UPI003678A540